MLQPKLQPCDSSMNDFNLQSTLLSSPSSDITLGLSFTPLKDLASSTEFQNESVSDQAMEAEEPILNIEATQSTIFNESRRRKWASLWQVESVSCSIADPESRPKPGRYPIKDSQPKEIVSVQPEQTCLQGVITTEEGSMEATEFKINKDKDLDKALNQNLTSAKLFQGNLVNTQNEKFGDNEKTKPELIVEIAMKKSDPTQKASEMLTKALLEQQKMHAGKKNKSEAKCERKPYSGIKSKKRKLGKNLGKNATKPAKKAKIQQAISSQGTIKNDFGCLKLVPLKKYEIPMVIVDIEKKIDVSYLYTIESNIEYSASDQEHYFHAYTALLYLNETAESIYLQEFNQQFIRLSYSQVGTTFQIKNSVSSIK